MEVRLNSLLLFLKALPNGGNSECITSVQFPHQRAFKNLLFVKKTEISSGIVISHQEAS